MFVTVRNYIRKSIKPLRWLFLHKIIGIDLHPSAIISFGAFLDRTRPQLIRIGADSIISRGAVILSHDYTRGKALPTVIGECCFIGVNSVVLPGVSIGDNVVVGAGSVVTKDVPSNSLVAGNPAKIMRNIQTGPFGKILNP